jgi:uncharacterized protein
MVMRVLRHADRIAQPWKNGGGVTREVAVFPPGAGMSDFEWRVSIADVSSAGPFSRFEGIDRILTVIDGQLRLTFAEANQTIVLRPGENHAFVGEADVVGAPVEGLVRDLNVMVRRGLWQARIDPYRPNLKTGDVRIAIAGNDCLLFAPQDALVLAGDENAPFGFSGYLITLMTS